MFNKANAKMLVDSTIVNTIYKNLLKIFIVFHIIKFTFIIPVMNSKHLLNNLGMI